MRHKGLGKIRSPKLWNKRKPELRQRQRSKVPLKKSSELLVYVCIFFGTLKLTVCRSRAVETDDKKRVYFNEHAYMVMTLRNICQQFGIWAISI